MAKRRGGPGGDFELDNNFDALAKVADELRGEIEKLVAGVKDAIKSIRDATSSPRKGGSGSGSPGGGGGNSAGGGGDDGKSVAQAKQLTEEQKKQREETRKTREEKKLLAEEQKKAALSALMWRNEVEKARNAIQAVRAVGDLAKLLGFKNAADDIEAVAKGLDDVQKILVGLKDGGPALASMAVFAAAALAGVVAVQEGVKQGTGETLSLKNAIAGAALTLYQVLDQSAAGWKLLFNDLSLFVTETFATIGRAVLRPILEALVALGVSMQSLGMKLQESTNPALSATGDVLRDLARAAIDASDSVEETYDNLGRGAAEARQQTEVENQAIVDSFRATKEGVQEQINKLFDQGGTSVFDNPLGALSEFREQVRGALESLGAGAERANAGAQRAQDALRGLRQELLGLDLQEAQTGFQRLSLMQEQIQLSREQRTLALESSIRELEAQARVTSSAEDRLRIEEEIKRVREEGTALIDKIEQAENRNANKRSQEVTSAGAQAGQAYSSAAAGAITDGAPELKKAFIDALMVDADDETRVIRSFSDLIENIGKLFLKNPLGFLGGLLNSGATGSGGGAYASGFAAGGSVSGGGAPSLAHFSGRAIGRAMGGFGRPPGIAPSDTVPAWLTPGEYVQPLAAVRHYGAQVMESLRNLSLPRESLMALASGVSVPAPVSTPRPRGYATGGAVASAGMAPGGAATHVVQPAIVANERTMEELLRGGEVAMLRFMQKHRGRFA